MNIFDGCIIGGRMYSDIVPLPIYKIAGVSVGDWYINEETVPNGKQVGDLVLSYNGEDICAIDTHNVFHRIKKVPME